jgi:hypothetical protein
MDGRVPLSDLRASPLRPKLPPASTFGERRYALASELAGCAAHNIISTLLTPGRQVAINLRWVIGNPYGVKKDLFAGARVIAPEATAASR